MREDGINTRVFERGGRDYLRKVAILYLLNECHTASRITIRDALHRLFTSHVSGTSVSRRTCTGARNWSDCEGQ